MNFFYLYFLWKASAYNITEPTPKPTPYYNLRLVTPKGVISNETFRKKYV